MSWPIERLNTDVCEKKNTATKQTLIKSVLSKVPPIGCREI